MHFRINRKKLIASLIITTVSLILWFFAVFVQGHIHKYLYQAIRLFAMLLCLYGVILLGSALKFALKKFISEPLAALMKKISHGFGYIKKSWRAVFGSGAYVSPFGGSDEWRFIIGKKKGKTEKKNTAKLPKYSDLTKPRDKIRYIYAKFVLERIKKGFCVKVSDTPNELSGSLCKTPEEMSLIELYTSVRYSDDLDHVSEETVNEALKLIKNR